MYRCTRYLTALSLLLLIECIAFGQAPSYSITDLGGNTSSLQIHVTGVNRSGQVVGYTTDPTTNQTLAFRTAANQPMNLSNDYLGTLGGSGTCGTSMCSSWALGINASGQVAGYSTTNNGEVHGFRTAANQPINPATDDLGSLGGLAGANQILTEGLGINDSGQAVGSSVASSGASFAFRTAPNKAISPATDSIDPNLSPGESSSAFNINSSGDAAGRYHGTTTSYENLYVAYHDGSFAKLPFLIAPGNGFSNINDADQVTGGESGLLVVWQNGESTPLLVCQNTEYCLPNSLNNLFQTVGTLQDPGGATRAFLYTGGTVYDLNTFLPGGSGWSLMEALSINDSGQIVGDGIFNGVSHAFRLDPTPPAFTYSVTASASAISVPQGGSATDTMTVALQSGTPGTTSFSTSMLPPGVTATFSSPECTPACTTTMTITASTGAFTGVSNFLVFANSQGFSANTRVSLTITTASGGSGFTWTLSGPQLSVMQGNSVAGTLTATLTSGSAGPVDFITTSSLPPGTTVNFSAASCTPTCTTTVTITTSYPATPPGLYSIAVSGTCGCSQAGAQISLSVSAGSDIASGLVAWWKMNDGAGNTAADSSGNQNNATLTSPSWWTSNYGATNLFNGSNAFGSVSETPSLEATGQITVAFWIRPTSESSTDQRVIDKLYDWDVKLTSTNHPQFDANGNYAELNYHLFSGIWSHVAFTFSNGTVTGYVNGQQRLFVANTFTSGASLLNLAYGLYLATDPSNTYYFGGSLNDIRIYNRALTAAEISTVYGYLPSSVPYTFSVSAESSSISVAAGSSATDNITATLNSGTSVAVSFEASGLPSGADAQWAFTACDPTCTNKMTIHASSTTPPGTYNIHVSVSGGGSSASTTVTLTVTAGASFAYSLSAASSTVSVAAGSSASDQITATLSSGTASQVSFSTSGLPAGATATFSPAGCIPSCSTTMTISAAPTTPVGVYRIAVNGSGGASASTSVSLSVGSGSRGPDITAGLMAWWKFNDGSGNTAADSSGNGNNATLFNPAWTTSDFGVTNFFSGAGSYGLVNESAGLEMTDQLTVGFWLRPSANSDTDPRVISKAYDWDVKLNAANRYPQFDAGGYYAQLNAPLTLNTWSHVVFTYNNGTVKGYVNGAPASFLASTFTGSGSLNPWPYNLYLAVHDSSQANPYAGDLDDVRVYHRALTDQDVAALYAYLGGGGSTSASYSLSVSSSTISLAAGASGTDQLTATLVSGTASSISFGASGLPSGATATFSPSGCTPNCSTTMTIATSSTTPAGSYTVMVAGSGGGASANTSVTLTVTGGGGAPDITTGLMAWWKFNDGSGNTAADSSGNGNNAALFNPRWTTSDYGATNFFSGSGSYGQVNETASLEMTDQLTVAFWLRPSSNPETDPRVISKTYDWDVKLNAANRYPQFDAGGAYAELNAPLPLDTWNHVVFTFSNGTVKGYVNGAPVSFQANTFTGSGSLPSFAYNLYLAAHDSSQSNPFAGDLDDVRVYHRALSDQDVAALYAYLPANH